MSSILRVSDKELVVFLYRCIPNPAHKMTLEEHQSLQFRLAWDLCDARAELYECLDAIDEYWEQEHDGFGQKIIKKYGWEDEEATGQ